MRSVEAAAAGVAYGCKGVGGAKDVEEVDKVGGEAFTASIPGAPPMREETAVESSSPPRAKRETEIFELLCNCSTRSCAESVCICILASSFGVVQPDDSGGETSALSSPVAIRSSSEKLPLMVIGVDGFRTRL